MSQHALSFRVMRLCRPSLSAELPLRYSPLDLLPDTELAEEAGQAQQPEAQQAAGGAGRSVLSRPSQALGLEPVLELPVSFGQIHIGEPFIGYLSVGCHSAEGVSDVKIRAELHTERHKTTLYEAAVPTMQPGARHDFIVRHDVREIGTATLVCTTAYAGPDGAPSSLPQFFKFQAANPLSVRTKARAVVPDQTFLEACVENATRGPLALDSVRFDPLPGLTCTPLRARAGGSGGSSGSGGLSSREDPDEGGGDPELDAYIDSLQLISQDGSENFLFRIGEAREPPPPGSAARPPGALGKLDIRWRGVLGDAVLGEAGRLQTQPISASTPAPGPVQLTLAAAPAGVGVEAPFRASVAVANRSGALVQDAVLEVAPAPAPAPGSPSAPGAAPPDGPTLSLQGPASVDLGSIEPGGSVWEELELVAASGPGPAALPPLQVRERGSNRVLGSLNSHLLVSPPAVH